MSLIWVVDVDTTNSKLLKIKLQRWNKTFNLITRHLFVTSYIRLSSHHNIKRRTENIFLLQIQMWRHRTIIDITRHNIFLNTLICCSYKLALSSSNNAGTHWVSAGIYLLSKGHDNKFGSKLWLSSNIFLVTFHRIITNVLYLF